MSAPLAAAVDLQAQPTTTAFQRDYRLSKHQDPLIRLRSSTTKT